MIIEISKKLTEFFIENKVIQEEENEVYQYSFELLLSSVLNLISILLLAVLMKRLIETLIFVLVFFTLRTQIGGYHARTHFRCYLLTILNYVVFLIFLNRIPTEGVWQISHSFIMLSVVLIYLLAPIADDNKPLDDCEYLKYKGKSRILIMIYLIAVLVCFLIPRNYGYYSNCIALSISIGCLLSANSLFIAWVLKSIKRKKQFNEKI